MTSCVSRVALIIGFAVFAPALLSAPGDRTPAVSLVLTQKAHALESDAVVDCRGRINAFLTFAEPLAGRHLLEGVWTLPDGAPGAHAKVPLDYPPEGRRTAELWLELDGGTGGPVGGVLGGGPGRGEFNGRWRLEVRLDGTTVLRTSFQMTCS